MEDDRSDSGFVDSHDVWGQWNISQRFAERLAVVDKVPDEPDKFFRLGKVHGGQEREILVDDEIRECDEWIGVKGLFVKQIHIGPILVICGQAPRQVL